MPARLALLIAAVALTAMPAGAQGLLDPGPATASPAERPEYSGYAGELTQREFIQAKAAAKSARRNAVLAARQWYGYSQSRPATVATPFTGTYGAHSLRHSYSRSAYSVQRPVFVVR